MERRSLFLFEKLLNVSRRLKPRQRGAKATFVASSLRRQALPLVAEALASGVQ